MEDIGCLDCGRSYGVTKIGSIPEISSSNKVTTGIPQLYPPQRQPVCSGKFLDCWSQLIPFPKAFVSWQYVHSERQVSVAHSGAENARPRLVKFSYGFTVPFGQETVSSALSS